MKKIQYKILITFTLFSLLTACDILEPEDDNVYDLNDIKSVVTYFEGFLIKAYRNTPTSHNTFNLSYASDDAVNNVSTSSVKNMVLGGWTSSSNPVSVWKEAYESIFYINTFLEEMNDVEWYWKNEITNEYFAKKLNGEAYALRAWFYFNLLQAHAGVGSNNELLGVPLVDHVLSSTNYQIPRSSFTELVQFIIDDCDRALKVLPDRWVDSGDTNIDAAFGARNTNRINGITVRLIKAKTLLYAASPAYSNGTYTYQMAAEAAAELMDRNNGLDAITFTNTKNLEFYSNPDVPNAGDNHSEVLWYSTRSNSSNNWEKTNYPPSLYGQGLTNPTQNLVDAFPLIDGQPTPLSKINSDDPYSGRDPRLEKYILYNGSQFKNGDKVVTINVEQGSQDALGSSDGHSTKTGYYIKKFMNVSDVNLDPNVNSGGLHYYTYARYTDALLIFAEAANQAVGPDGVINGYSARDVINAIRNRAGITSSNYVDGLSKDQMVNLIRNERRLEMCFEKERFWDLRRWKMISEMKAPVSGVEVSSGGNHYNYIEVEKRNYSDYQIYGPIPYDETLKYELIQNKGWK